MFLTSDRMIVKTLSEHTFKAVLHFWVIQVVFEQKIISSLKTYGL